MKNPEELLDVGHLFGFEPPGCPKQRGKPESDGIGEQKHLLFLESIMLFIMVQPCLPQNVIVG